MLRFYHETVSGARAIDHLPEAHQRSHVNPRDCRWLATATLGRIEHPRWHLERRRQLLALANEHHCATPIYGSADVHVDAVQRMPRVNDAVQFCFMGVEYLGCTIPNVRTAVWLTGHQMSSLAR